MLGNVGQIQELVKRARDRQDILVFQRRHHIDQGLGVGIIGFIYLLTQVADLFNLAEQLGPVVLQQGVTEQLSEHAHI